MNVTPLAIPDVKLIVPRRIGDARGYFVETHNERTFAAAGITTRFVQDNHAYSAEAGTLRGLHLQRAPHAQTKLVRCVRGRLFDVAVDVRAASPTFGQWVSAELSAENGAQLYVPQGFLHGYLTLEPHTEVIYKVDDHYAPREEAGVIWSDPDIAIAWPTVVGTPHLSDKDARLPRLRDLGPIE
jgi:dTDP-4-dehydrorhamnose 3,5-epimerase